MLRRKFAALLAMALLAAAVFAQPPAGGVAPIPVPATPAAQPAVAPAPVAPIVIPPPIPEVVEPPATEPAPGIESQPESALGTAQFPEPENAAAEQPPAEPDPETAAGTETKLEPEAEPWQKSGRAWPEYWLSIGGGVFFASDFGGGLISDGKVVFTMPHYGGGVYLFFDAVYAEFFAGYSFSTGTLEWEAGGSPDFGPDIDMRRTYLNGGMFLKYPFELGIIKLFPLLGADYERSLSFTAELPDGHKFELKTGNKDAKALSALWFKFGAGLDADITSDVYIRAQFLYGFRGINYFEDGLVDLGSDRKASPGHGATFRIGTGVKF